MGVCPGLRLTGSLRNGIVAGITGAGRSKFPFQEFFTDGAHDPFLIDPARPDETGVALRPGRDARPVDL